MVRCGVLQPRTPGVIEFLEVYICFSDSFSCFFLFLFCCIFARLLSSLGCSAFFGSAFFFARMHFCSAFLSLGCIFARLSFRSDVFFALLFSSLGCVLALLFLRSANFGQDGERLGSEHSLFGAGSWRGAIGSGGGGGSNARTPGGTPVTGPLDASVGAGVPSPPSSSPAVALADIPRSGGGGGGGGGGVVHERCVQVCG